MSVISRRGLPHELVVPAVMALDIAVAAAAYVASTFAYGMAIGFSKTSEPEFLIELAGVAALVGGLFCATAYRNDFYRFRELVNPHPRLGRLISIWGLAFLGLMLALFAFKVGASLSRGGVLTFGVVGGTTIVLTRLALAPVLRSLATSGVVARKRIIVVGTGPELATVPSDQELEEFGLLRVASFRLANFSDAWSEEVDKAMIAEVVTMARSLKADEIYLALPWAGIQRIRAIRQLFNVLPISVQLLPDATVARIARYRAQDAGFARTFELQRQPLTLRERILKRSLDVILAGAGLVAVSPVLALVALAIRLDSAGPIIFRQRRRGFGGETFTIYKFRTMTVLEDGDRVTQASRGDSRITRVGRFLRKTSLDELPQILNVLFGSMSLVGPRPHALAHDDSYGQLLDNYAYRHHVKPGITGWAQVNGLRGETSTLELMSERVKFDLWYINHWSIWLDVWILFRTVAEVLRRRNAY